MATTDTELIRRWARGQDAEAFRELVNRYAGMVYSATWRVMGNAADAEDLTQESFLKLSRLRRPVRNVAAWLHRVAINGAIDTLRADATRRAKERHWEAPARIRGEVEWQDVEPFLDEAIDALPEHLRTALVLYYLRNETQETIATSLGVSQATVSHRVRKGVEAIRKQLRRRGVGLAPLVLLGWLETRVVRPAPPSLFASLGKVAIVGSGVRRTHRTARPPGAGPVVTNITGDGWMKAAFLSVAGLVVVGLVAIVVSTPPRVPEPEREVPPTARPEGRDQRAAAETPAAPASALEGDVTPPPGAATRPAVVGGTIRDEKEKPVAFADVYLALTPPPEDDIPGLFFSEDYFRRSRFLQTKTDGEGRYVFEEIAHVGYGTLGAFKEHHSGPRGVGSTAPKTVRIDEGAVRDDIDLVMAEGKTLRGRVVGPDGLPVTDAVVSVATAWSPAEHVFWPAGLGCTGMDGRFRLGLEPKATGCHVRVNSDSHGQDFFTEVPVSDEDVTLTLSELAQVRGTITWTDGSPAAGLTVRVCGRLPEPPIPVGRAGRRSEAVHDGLVGPDGAYLTEGLCPSLGYYIFVIDGSLGERAARTRPLTPRLANAFRIENGGVKVWNHAVPRPLFTTIRGTIHTEVSDTPLPGGRIGIRKDGKVLLEGISAEADRAGTFELQLTSGPGEYVVHALPPGNAPAPRRVGDLIAERFGKTLTLTGGEEIELDLVIFEPTVRPVRVLDQHGEPVHEVFCRFHATFPGGGRISREGTRVLDDAGTAAFKLYVPITEFWYEISELPGGPTVETPRQAGTPGTVLREQTVTLPPTCALLASIVDPSGEPHRERRLLLRLIYKDGLTKGLTSRTDRQGVLDERGRVRAAPFTLELRSADSEVLWRSGPLDGSEGGVVQLGRVVIE